MLIDTITKSSRHSKIAVSVMIVVIVSVAAYNWLVAPHISYLHAAEQYQFAVKNMATQNNVIKNSLNGRKEKLEKFRRDLAKTRAMIFTASGAKRFFSSIEAISSKADCLIYSINFLSEKNKSDAKSAQNVTGIIPQRVFVNFAGTFSNLIKFLTKLTDRPQKVSIDSIRIEATNSDPTLLECEMIFTIYRVEDKEVPGNE